MKHLRSELDEAYAKIAQAMALERQESNQIHVLRDKCAVLAHKETESLAEIAKRKKQKSEY